MAPLSGKVAFITGAARGQGRAHVVRLASDGADIIAVDLCDQIASVPYPMATADDLAETVKLVEDAGARIVAREADVRDQDSLKSALQQGLDEFGGLDIVVANAGIAPMQAGTEGWQDVIDVNLTGVHHTVEIAKPVMIEQGRGGSIVLISSAAGLAGIGSSDAGSIGYAAAKHGLVGLMRVYANHLAQHSIRVNSIHPAGVDTPMINNEFIRAMVGEDGHRDRDSEGHGQPSARPRFATGGHRQRGGVVGIRRSPVHHRGDPAGRRRLPRQALMARGERPAARTAFGPMVLAAIEQHERPGRRLVHDDLATAFLPTTLRWLVAAMRWTPAATGAHRVDEPVSDLACGRIWPAANVSSTSTSTNPSMPSTRWSILGAGMDTRAYRLARERSIPVFEVDLPINIARKESTVRHVLGEVPSSVRLVPVDFEIDDVAVALAEHGYRADDRAFFVWEGVTQYLTADGVHATFAFLQQAAPGSRLVFTYIRDDFISGVNLYGANSLYRRFRQRRQVWRFGMRPESVPTLLAGYGWHLVVNAGPDYLEHHYVRPTGRNLTASQIEWSVYAEKR